MAYFTQEMKKQVVARLKENFPGWKFSVRVGDNSTLYVGIKQAPIDLLSNYLEVTSRKNDNMGIQLNHYYLDNAFSGEFLEKMEELKDTMNLVGDKSANYNRSDTQADHFDVGYYIAITLGGGWNKPFEYVPTEAKVSRKMKM